VSSVDVAEGDTAYWKVTVTNTGDTPLADVTVSDPSTPACDTTGVTLAVGASLSTYCTTPDISGAVVNVATASFAGELPPFPSSSAQVEDSPAVVGAGSVATIAPVTTSGAVDTLVPVQEAPVVTG
jgi:hypothetical protein